MSTVEVTQNGSRVIGGGGCCPLCDTEFEDCWVLPNSDAEFYCELPFTEKHPRPKDCPLLRGDIIVSLRE